MSQLKVNSIVPVGGLPSGANGGIIQVIQAVKTDSASFTSSSFVDISGLSATITPSSSSNKILCDFRIYFGKAASGSTAKVNIVRGSTNIGQPTGSSTTHQSTLMAYSTGHQMFPVGMNFLDSPATTNATTYKLQIARDNTSNTIYINRYHGSDSYHAISTLTLYEVTT